MNLSKKIIKPVLFPMIIVLIILLSNYFITKDTFSFIKPKIEKEYSHYLKVRDSNTDLPLPELYSKFPEVPVSKLISIDIITTSPLSLQSEISYYVSSYCSTIKDKELLIADVSNELKKLSNQDSKIRTLFFTLLFISLLSISLLISYFINVYIKK